MLGIRPHRQDKDIVAWGDGSSEVYDYEVNFVALKSSWGGLEFVEAQRVARDVYPVA
ncbi:hypothetical protein VDGD_21477 [Verticillium dahliae]|nr:hypothetical protein VDGD_21477 [Verticillium dahliae]